MNKRYLLTLLVSVLTIALLSISAFAQEESQHLTFKGVPIDGTLEQFVAQMNQKGFVGHARESGFAYLKGDFAGYKGCFVQVSTLRSHDSVSSIEVQFPAIGWSAAETCYSRLKGMLTTKYGEPSSVKEKFERSFASRDDDGKEWELLEGRATYETIFKTDKGEITLKINRACRVVLIYFDKINSDAFDAAALADL